ncbi:MAG: Amylosucrase [Actinomycetota bacterium]
MSIDTAAEIAILSARAQLAIALSNDPDVDEILTRFDRWKFDLWEGLAAVYDAQEVFPKLIDVIVQIHKDRNGKLRHRDRERLLNPDWFQDNKAIGYVAYTDLFAKDLNGVQNKIDYLNKLGITYLHLMPLLTPRPGENDGGYAVMDYKSVRSDLGTMKDFAELAQKLHDNGISLTLDLVLNHVAKEHEWAMKAKSGDAKYREYFYVYSDRKTPDEFEKTLPEIFPTFAPGNFTWDEKLNGWVWTTFNEYQWDVNWSNPNVFLEYLDIIGYLANQGADCLRLDAIAFIWKRLGTNSQNQPEVHAITQALRTAAHIMAPALIFKAEAIVGPKDVVHYLGQGKHAGKVSDMAYHNSLMVQIWSALASRDGRLLATALSRFAPIPTTSGWATYLRCHDDIGWAIDDADAAAIGLNGAMHREFCASFYANEFPESFARGVHFQSNPATGDRRTSGSAASLIGIEAALDKKNASALDIAIDRLTCAYAMVFGFGGLPLLYMGDELGLLNDRTYLDNPTKKDDNRWIHRPEMRWDLVDNPNEAISARVFAAIENLIRVRKQMPALHAAVNTEAFTTSKQSVLVFRRQHAAGSMIQVYNLSEKPQVLEASALWPLTGTQFTEHLSGKQFRIDGSEVLPPYASWWLTSAN